MNLYIYFDSSDLEEIVDPIESELSEWVANGNRKVIVVNQKNVEAAGLNEENHSDWNLGVNFSIKKISQLKEPLNFMYSLAKKYKRDCVIGFVDADTGIAEDVCYFGNEEGRPDMHEIGNYLCL